MSLLRAIATVGGLTMVSRVLGFGRDVLIARVLGAGPVADAFFVALVLPNSFRRLFGEGAFSVAFVPMFARLLAGDGRAVARAFAEQAQALLTTVLVVGVVAGLLTMDRLVPAIAPGFADDPERLATAVTLARITFPYLLLICLVALLGGVLNALDRFAAMAATPILFNLTLIAALATAELAVLQDGTGAPGIGTTGIGTTGTGTAGIGTAGIGATPTAAAGHLLAWGVSLSGVLQFAWMLWHCHRAGFRLAWRLPRVGPRMRALLRVMLPALAAHGVMQINLLVGTLLASLLPAGAISYLYYADRVNQLPLGVVGVAVATAMLPKLSTALRRDDHDAAADHLNRSLEIAMLLTLPAAAALAVIAPAVIDGLFRRGAFTAADSAATAAALVAFAGGLPAFVLVKVLSTGFFAREDTATPFRIGVVAMAVNIGLGALLMQTLAHVGLALATSLAGWVNAGLLAVLLARRGRLPLDRRLRRRLPLIALATAVLVAALLGLQAGLAPLLAGDGPARLAGLAGLVAGGGLVYAALCQVTGAARLSDLRRLLRRQPSPGPDAITPDATAPDATAPGDSQPGNASPGRTASGAPD